MKICDICDEPMKTDSEEFFHTGIHVKCWKEHAEDCLSEMEKAWQRVPGSAPVPIKLGDKREAMHRHFVLGHYDSVVFGAPIVTRKLEKIRINWTVEKIGLPG